MQEDKVHAPRLKILNPEINKNRVEGLQIITKEMMSDLAHQADIMTSTRMKLEVESAASLEIMEKDLLQERMLTTIQEKMSWKIGLELLREQEKDQFIMKDSLHHNKEEKKSTLNQLRMRETESLMPEEGHLLTHTLHILTIGGRVMSILLTGLEKIMLLSTPTIGTQPKPITLDSRAELETCHKLVTHQVKGLNRVIEEEKILVIMPILNQNMLEIMTTMTSNPELLLEWAITEVVEHHRGKEVEEIWFQTGVNRSV